MTWNANAQAALINRDPIARRWLFWAEPKNRATGAVEQIGVWDGDDDEFFNPTGSARLYYGASGNFSVGPLSYRVGTQVQGYELGLSGLSPAVEQLVRGYEPRFAKCDLHLALFDSGGVLIDTGRMFTGFIDAVSVVTGEVGGTVSMSLQLVSAARAGTTHPALTKSDAQQRRRSNDAFRQYGDVSGIAPDWWGSRRG